MSIAIDECGGNELQSEQNQRARVKHSCCACKETIRVGDLYRRLFMVYEGQPGTWKYCLRCALLLSELERRHRGSDETVDLELNCGHTWEETQGGPPPEYIARLAFMTPDEIQARFAPPKTAKLTLYAVSRNEDGTSWGLCESATFERNVADEVVDPIMVCEIRAKNWDEAKEVYEQVMSDAES